MSVTLRSFIIAAVLIIIAGLMYHFSSMTGQLSDEEIMIRYPTFEAKNFNAEIYDKQGRLTHSLTADDVSYFQHKDYIQVNNITGMFYNQWQGKPVEGWQVTADSGYMVFNLYAKLQGDIKVTPHDKEAWVKEIATPSVFFNIVKNTISSEDEITIKGDKFINKGSDYIVDLNNKTFVIKENPHAAYYP